MKEEDIEEENIKRNRSLGAEERETVISWCDDDKDILFIYTSQPPMIRKLLKNKSFELKDKHTSKDYKCYPNPIAIEGYLPKKLLTIRSKGNPKRVLTDEQRKIMSENFKKNVRRKRK